MTEARAYQLDARESFTRGKRVTVEASAGTGKTYALTATVARLVAEQGLQANQLLLMTFTNEATEELRQITRIRCQEALSYLRGVGKSEPWMSNLAEVDSELGAEQIGRLGSFLQRFDEVTITTIHGFCQTVLKRAGLASLAPPSFELVPNIDQLVDQSISDRLTAKLSANPGYLTTTSRKNGEDDPGLSSNDVAKVLKVLRSAVKTSLDNDGAVVLPAPLDDKFGNDAAKLEHELTFGLEKGKKEKDKDAARLDTRLGQVIADEVRAIVDEIRSRCSNLGVVTYNDLIRLVRQSLDLTTPSGQRLATLLATQYPIVMVDEFQDTDAAQAAILDVMFDSGDGAMTLFTVGDPKQAIYRFRGADVNVYLRSKAKAHEVFELQTNWRSDPALLTALEILLADEVFGSGVGFTKVNAAPATAAGLSVRDAAPIDASSLEIRYLPNQPQFGAGKNNNAAGLVRRKIREDLVARVRQLLATATIPNKQGVEQPLSPSDVAILVHSHTHAEEIVRSLTEALVPAVQLKTGSVFATNSALHWQMLLRGLARPASARAARTFALSWFGGETEEDLLNATDTEIAELQRTCVEKAEKLLHEGVTATYLSFRNEEGFLKRVLSQPNGLRHLTDLDHIAEVLEGHPSLVGRAGATETLEIVTMLMDEQSEEADNEQRRIQTDLDSVKVMTIYASKGLEFPVVFLPTLNHAPKARHPLMFPAELESDKPSVRVVDVASGAKPAAKWRFTPKLATGADVANMWKDSFTKDGEKRGRSILAKRDVQEDRRRLLYVAMTRAKHKIIAYWSPTGKGTPSDPFIEAIQRVSPIPVTSETNSDDASKKKSKKSSTPDTKILFTRDDLLTVMNDLETKSHGAIMGVDLSDLEMVVDEHDSATKNESDNHSTVADFERDDSSVRVYGYGRWSYSSIVRALESRTGDFVPPPVPEHLPGVTDEDHEELEHRVASEANDVWQGLPAGRIFGNAVHNVIDRINPAAPDLDAEVAAEVEIVFAAWGDRVDRTRLTNSLVANITTPLDSVFGGYSLAQLGTKHRLSEMGFDYPLCANSSTAVDVILQALADDDQLPEWVRKNYSQLLAEGLPNSQIAGLMTGFIDAVFRIPTSTEKFIVCDYKTNLLSSYDQLSMATAMLKSGYYVQAMVYSVALHRYLRQRITDYSYDAHFGGVSYLFLRGIDGSQDKDSRLHGSYCWKPTETIVRRLDEALSEAAI